MTDFIAGTPKVPEISDERIQELMQTMEPIVRKGSDFFKIAPCHPRKVAFTVDPKVLEFEPVVGLKEIQKIKTHHRCRHPCLFKPFIAEVLSQIPEDLIGQVKFFEINLRPSDPDEDVKIFNDGRGHLATTILYSV